MLYGLIQPHTSVSIVGMCKNAGKTTVLNQMIADCQRAGERIGLTSIGRDGERSDVVTSTKKPEIYVFSGTVIATAEDALPLGDISREILDTTGMPTPMGEVAIVRAMSDGFVQLAGPSMTAQLKRVRGRMIELGADRVFIDGALGRKSLSMPAVSDAAILCSGASYSRDMRKTVADTAFAAALMGLEKTQRNAPELEEKFTAVADGEVKRFGSAKDAADGIRSMKAEALFIKGGVTDKAAEELLSAGRFLSGMELVTEDSSRLLVSPGIYEKLRRAGARLTVLEKTKLLAVTVNPFSAYGDHYDKDRFINEVRRSVPEGIPVLNVKAEDA